MEGDYPKFAREVGTGKPRRKSDSQVWEDLKRKINYDGQQFERNPQGLIPTVMNTDPYHTRSSRSWHEFARAAGIIEDPSVPRGEAWALNQAIWRNPLLVELKERRAAEVAGAALKWPSLREGTAETERQYRQVAHEWMQDDITVQFDEVGNELYVHSRWGVLGLVDQKYATDEWKKSLSIPFEHDKRSGARYWPIGRV